MKLLLVLIASVLSAQTIPWPAIGPDVTGGNGAAGHAYDVPAKLCYRATPIDHTFDGPLMAISLAHWASGKITITALEAGLLPPTAIFTVSGVSPSGHNGTFGINLQIYGTLTVPQTVNPGLYSSGGTIKLSSGGTQQYFVTGATWAANEITFSTPGSSTFPMGSTVTVAGVIPAGYNGTYTTDSSPTPAKITFVQPANPGADGTTGTIQYTPNILAYDARTCYASY